MKYCKNCLLPSTKPYISFDENGVCSACRTHESKKDSVNIDWMQREQEFEQIVDSAKKVKAPFYDALVPVSGGKDSITQVHHLLSRDFRILAVNVDYGIKTEIGNHNLSCIPKMGANLITYRPDLKLHKELIRIGFENYGDPDLLSHTLLHAYPLHVAIQFNIPLVVLGENSAFEYGGEKNIASLNHINRDWFAKFAANQGRDARYVTQKYNIPIDKLLLYDFPDGLENSLTKTVFLSHYFNWNSDEHLKIAKTYGFKSLAHASEGTYRNYVGIDEKINRIHQYMKVLKFGYGRATDHACEDIRNGKIKRNEAKKLVMENDLLDLSDYYVNDFCKFMDISKDHFFEVIEKYRNDDIWHKDAEGRWIISGHLKDNNEGEK